MLPTRPRPGETEEDVLRLQQEFLEPNRRTAASAKVVRFDKRTNDDGSRPTDEPVVDSDTAESSKGDASAKRFKANDHRSQRQPPSPLLIEDPPSLDTVLGDIVERDTRTSRASPPKTDTVGESFPVVHQCDPKELLQCLASKPVTDGGRRNGSSIFARRMHATRKERSPLVVTAKPTGRLMSDDDCSRVVDGTGLDPARSEQLAREIHAENLATLSRMSVEEILEQRNRLVESLDAKTLEFVRSMRHDVKKVSDDRIGGQSAAGPSQQPSTSPSEMFGGLESGKWLHMDKVETDKLAWIRPLSESKLPVDPKTGCRARFNFDGGLVSRDSDVPVHHGLHHHGDEPEVAGYTLEELFTYGRSSILQQRVLALTTLARILQRYSEGDHDQCLVDAAQFLPQLLDSGLMLLLRWALDDNTESCLVATVSAIHALLVRTADDYFLDGTFCWSRGHEQPYLRPARTEKKDDELSDAELVAVDVVKGLVRMDILPRLRYVLEVIRPSSSPAVVHHSLAILDRLARHSPQVAQAIYDCLRLVETVFREFLPKSWTIQGTTTSVYGLPIREAVRLMRTLASSSRRLAADLLQRHDLMASLLCYASADSSDLVDSDLARLSLEAYRTWTVFVHHGLAVEYFSDFYPLIVRQLRFCHSLCLNVDVDKRKSDCDYAAQLIGLLTTAIGPLASNVDASSPSSAWNQLLPPLLLPIELCLKKWLWEAAHADETTSASLKLIGVALTFVATFYEASVKVSDDSMNDVAACLEDLFSLAIVPFLESNGLRLQLERLSECSVLSRELQPSGDRDVPSLPSLGALLRDGRVHPMLTELSPFPLLCHLVRALIIFRRVHSPLRHTICGSLMAGEEIEGYLHRLSSARIGTDRSDWFARFEAHFVADLMALHDASPLPSCHDAATTVLHQLQSGDEQLAVHLLTSVIFSENFLRRMDDNDDVQMEPMDPRFDDSSVSRTDLLRRTRGSLADICGTYLKAVAKLAPAPNGGTLMMEYSCVPIVPPGFEYSPITDLFFADSKNAVADYAVDESKLTAVVHCLQWSHFVQCRRRGDATRESRFCYLAMVTLIGTDVFLDSRIRTYLHDSVLLMVERGELLDMNLDSKPVPQMASFDDFYEQVLLQFEAVSYGDHLFGIFVLVPLQMSQPLRLRRSTWSVEHRSALRSLGVRPDELAIPLSAFLEPIETNAVLLDSYFSALLSGHVRSSWCPILYLIAVHHVHSFLFGRAGGRFASEQDASRAREMFRRLQNCGESSDLYRHVTLYAGPNRAVPLCFDLSDSLDIQVTTRLSEMRLCT